MRDVPPGDQIPLRVRRQPRRRRGPTCHLVLPDPVVLRVVQHRQQHVQLGQASQRQSPVRVQVDVTGVAPFGDPRVERNLVASTDQPSGAKSRRTRSAPPRPVRASAGTGSGGQAAAPCRPGRVGRAASRHRGAKHRAERHREHRRRRVGPVVDVLAQRNVPGESSCRAPGRSGRPRAAARPCTAPAKASG